MQRYVWAYCYFKPTRAIFGFHGILVFAITSIVCCSCADGCNICDSLNTWFYTCNQLELFSGSAVTMFVFADDQQFGSRPNQVPIDSI